MIKMPIKYKVNILPMRILVKLKGNNIIMKAKLKIIIIMKIKIKITMK